MRDQVWAAVCTLTENEGITFNDCLSLTLQVPQPALTDPHGHLVPGTDTSHHPLLPKSSIYRRWRPEQVRVSPFIRKSGILDSDQGVRWGHPQPYGRVDHPPSPAVSKNSAGSGRPRGSRDQSCSCAQSIPHATAGNQALPSPRSLMTTRNKQQI